VEKKKAKKSKTSKGKPSGGKKAARVAAERRKKRAEKKNPRKKKPIKWYCLGAARVSHLEQEAKGTYQNSQQPPTLLTQRR